MPGFVMRVWLADRPGALGAIASRIGAVGGDLVGIDILERGEGRVIDELAIELPSDELIPLLLSKVNELDAVDVEDIRASVAGLPHPQVDPLDVAADLLGESSVESLLKGLVGAVTVAFSAEWVAIVDPNESTVLAASSGSPAVPWLEAFIAGTRAVANSADGTSSFANDIAWAGLDVSALAILCGRSGRPFRARERRQLATVARIADHHWRSLVTAGDR